MTDQPRYVFETGPSMGLTDADRAAGWTDRIPSFTVGELIERLSAIRDQHGADTLVYMHDADTDWPLALGEDSVRLGKNEFGEGIDGSVMIQSVGYHG